MDNNLSNLMQAYSEVYANQESIQEATAMAKRGHDEPAIRTQIAKNTGGGQAADRATALANKTTYGNNQSTQQRQQLAAKQRSDFRKTTSSNPGLHVGQHKAVTPADKAKQAARGAQRSALTPNEKKQLNMGDETFDIFDAILEFLCVEGFAETLEEAEWIMANELDAEDIKDILGEADSLAAFQARREKRRASMKKKTGYEGHDYSKPPAQAAAEREQRMRDFINKK